MSSLKRNPDIGLDDLSSNFDPTDDVEGSKKSKRRKEGDLVEKDYFGEQKSKRSEAKEWFQDEHARLHRQISRLHSLDAYQRHKEMMNLYYLNYPGVNKHLLERDTTKDRTDYDVLKEKHRFLWTDEDSSQCSSSWEMRMAKKYYDKLFKEYCIVDLTHYRSNKFAMRWRVEKEVRSGKGQFVCGAKKCERGEDLSSWEVNFSYVEDGERKSALVKVRLCPECSDKLNYGSKKRKVHKDKKFKTKDAQKRGEIEKGEDGEGEGSGVKEDPSSSSTTSSKEFWSGAQPAEISRTVDNDIDDFLNDIFD